MGVKSRIGARVRHVIALAVEPRFEALDARLGRIEDSQKAPDVGYPSTRVEHDLFALRQQMDEALDVLRSLHARVRALEEAVDRFPPRPS